MSGISTSLTFGMPESQSAEIMRALFAGEMEVPDPGSCLHTLCRDNHLETFLQDLISAQEIAALVYLGQQTTLLKNEDVQDAAKALRALLEAIQQSPADWVDDLSYSCRQELDAAAISTAFAECPANLSAALAHFRVTHSRDDEEKLASCAAFLHAHLAVLEHALRQGQQVLYALWVY